MIFNNLYLDDCVKQALKDGKISSINLGDINIADNKHRSIAKHIKVIVTLNERKDWKVLYERDFNKVGFNMSFDVNGDLKLYVITVDYKTSCKSNFKPFHNKNGVKGDHVSLKTFTEFGFHSSILSLFS